MTINKPISAINIIATYNVITQTLTLTAEGEVGNNTYGIHFKMIALSSGLKFSLGARTCLDDIGNIPYQISESFKIQLPAYTLLSEALTILTQNEPDGELVPIYFVGMFQESELIAIAPEVFTHIDETPAKLTPVNKTINTRKNEPFGIKTTARAAEFAYT